MSKYIAIDIVLLPPARLMDELIEINRKILAEHPSELRLNKTNCVPHITLMQAIFLESDLAKLNSTLYSVVGEFEAIKVDGQLGAISDGIVGLQINSNTQLQLLHEAVMQNFGSLAAYDAKAEHFQGDLIPATTVNYVKNFKELHAFAKYDPHITLGHAKPGASAQKYIFTADRLAICQLGAHNTCTKVLFETSCK